MKLSSLILRAIFIVSIISILSTFLISIILQYNTFINERNYIKKELIELKKDEIKREVLKVYNKIKYEQELINQNNKKRIKERVEQAHNIATTIYEENKSSRNAQEIKYLILTALKSITYNEEKVYFFVNTNKGRALLFNKRSYLAKQKRIWNLRDKKGNYIIKRQSKIALEQGEGFITNYFIKPDTNNNEEYPKLSFVKNFKPYNWHIGTGEYLDDINIKIKERLLKEISSFRFGTDGYIFINSLDKKALVFDGRKLTPPKDYPNEILFKEQLDAIKNKDGGFFFYQFKKLNTTRKFPKLAYVKLLKDWNWIIGTGVYIDNIDNEIQRQEEIFRTAVIKQTGTNLIVIAFLFLIVFLVSKRISKYIDKNVKYLITHFKSAAKEHTLIKTKKLTFKEFNILGKNLNRTLISRNESESKLKNYIDIVNNNIIISSTDKAGVITDVSNAFCEISGYSRDELVGNSHRILRHPDMKKELYEEIWDFITSGKSWQGELKNKKKNGDYYWVDIVIHPKFEKEQIVGYTAIRHDITDKKKVEYLSITDELTQLYNRRHFNLKIEEELNRAKRKNYNISFIMLDIDYFKNYNDTYGHQAGDEALKKISKVLKIHTQRAGDYAFRIGGEEFAILVSFNKEKSIELIKSLQKGIEELAIEHKTSKVSPYITSSIGLVVREGSKLKDSNELYMLADKALYKAKEEGRNRVSIS